MAKLVITVLLLLLSRPLTAKTVQDGDSIIRGDGVRVRLYGIDAPEKTSLSEEKPEKCLSNTYLLLPR